MQHFTSCEARQAQVGNTEAAYNMTLTEAEGWFLPGSTQI